MKLIRCLNCNKVLGEVEGKAKIKCKMAGCHCMNVIDTDAGTQTLEPRVKTGFKIWEDGLDEGIEQLKQSSEFFKNLHK